MNLNSASFFLFVAIIVSINYFLSPRFRGSFLTLASLAFIGFYNIESFIVIIIFSYLNFQIAKIIRLSPVFFTTGILLNVLSIILFNYVSKTPYGFGFSVSTIYFEVNRFIVVLGLSFYSLQNIAYLTEVYYKRAKLEIHFPNYLLYNGFFPKIISGPVMMPEDFFPQIAETSVTSSELISGFQRLLLGLFKKMVIADRLAPSVASVFDYHNQYSGMTTLFAVYLFTIQLYFDFSGYTDMALGVAKMLGINLKENFALPLRSLSVSEFWRRWHISLISWFTTYIYYPLVFRLRKGRKAAALIGIAVTFFVSAIWHGIGLTFIAWAGCHAIYLSIELLTKRIRASVTERLNNSFFKSFCILIVFNAVCFSNIFFRADSVNKATSLINNIIHQFIPENWLQGFIAPLAVGGHQMDEFNFYISIFITGIVLLFERKINDIASKKEFNTLFVLLCGLLIVLFGVFNSGERFIYMQF